MTYHRSLKFFSASAYPKSLVGKAREIEDGTHHNGAIIQSFREEFEEILDEQFRTTGRGYMITENAFGNDEPHRLFFRVYGKAFTKLELHFTSNLFDGDFVNCLAHHCKNLRTLGFIFLNYNLLNEDFAQLISRLPKLTTIFIARGIYDGYDVNTQFCDRVTELLIRKERRIGLIVDSDDFVDNALYREYFTNFRQPRQEDYGVRVLVANGLDYLKHLMYNLRAINDIIFA